MQTPRMSQMQQSTGGEKKQAQWQRCVLSYKYYLYHLKAI